MRVLFLTSAHNSMSQRAYIELTEAGHEVSIELAINDRVMTEAVTRYQPDLVVAPMLKTAIPESIWRRLPCLIVHPGIKGDRGPSSLDWAILQGKKEWGVTLLQANEEMDAGDIWATRTFPMRSASKSSLYRNEVVDAAMDALQLAIDRFGRSGFRPEPLNYNDPAVLGRLQEPVRQIDRKIDWEGSTESVLRRIHSGDGSPGVLDTIAGEEYFLYGATEEEELTGPPGEIIAWRDGAICRATRDGAVWISHLKARGQGERALKLPATLLLDDRLCDVPAVPWPLAAPPRGRTYREIWYEESQGVGYLHFPFYNGAMSTRDCRRLLDAYRQACKRPTRVIALMGGPDFFSNGIHLTMIEAATSPADESWANIQAMDDLVETIIRTESHLVVAAIQGNAGAGGVILALAADRVYARKGVVLNPHYRQMGGLYGSEFWTYLLPRRIGPGKARELTRSCLPVGTRAAERIGLIDQAFGADPASFVAEVMVMAQELARHPAYESLLAAKRRRLAQDERSKPLERYRAEELAQMYRNFYGPDPSYHLARQQFVYKRRAIETPRHLALHRQ